MSFYSTHAPKIWEHLFNVNIPDLVTQNPAYLKKFGHPVTGIEELDSLRTNEYISVMVPIIRIAEYYSEGIVVEVPSRADMLRIHTNIELYLNEWKAYIQNSINKDLDSHKDMITALENLSRLIHGKAGGKELILKAFARAPRFGIVNPLQEQKVANAPVNKPEYEGISEMIRRHRQASRFGG